MQSAGCSCQAGGSHLHFAAMIYSRHQPLSYNLSHMGWTCWVLVHMVDTTCNNAAVKRGVESLAGSEQDNTWTES
jgi:hypothetical protein